MTGATNWTPYSVPELAGILDDDLSNAWEQVSAWFSADAMLDDAAGKLTAARAGLAAVWPPESSPAAQTFFQVVDALTESMSKTALAANTNANALSQVLNNHSDTKSKVDGLHSAWTANQKLASFDPEEFPTTSQWQSSLNVAAQQHMAASDNVVNEYASTLIVPPVIPVPGWIDQSTVIPGSDGTAGAPSGGGTAGIGGPGGGIPAPPGPTNGGSPPPAGSIPPLPGVPILTGGGPPPGNGPGGPPLGPGQPGLPLPPGAPGAPGAPGPGAPGIPVPPVLGAPIPGGPLPGPPGTSGGPSPGRGPAPGTGSAPGESGVGGGSGAGEPGGGAMVGEPGGPIGRPGGSIVGSPGGGAIGEASGGRPMFGEPGPPIGDPGIAGGRGGFGGAPLVGGPGEGGLGVVGGAPVAGGGLGAAGVGGAVGAGRRAGSGRGRAGSGSQDGPGPQRLDGAPGFARGENGFAVGASGAAFDVDGGMATGGHVLGRDGVLRSGGPPAGAARGFDVIDGSGPGGGDGTLRPRAAAPSAYTDGPGAAATLAPTEATASAGGADENGMPMLGGTGGAIGRRRTRRAVADVTWVMPAGGPAVLIPESEHNLHDPGPGVIGIDR